VKKLLLLLVVLWLVLPKEASATKYWYTQTGTLGSSCSQIATAENSTTPPAFRLSWLATWACMTPGDIFHFRAGTYIGANQKNATTNVNIIYETVVNVPNGTAGDPTIIEGEGLTGCAIAHTCNTVIKSDGHVIYDAQYITIQNLEIDGNNITGDSCFSFLGSGGTFDTNQIDSNVIIDNVEMHDCYMHGVYTQTNINHFTMRNFNIHDTDKGLGSIGGHGCYIEGDDTTLENFIIHDITLGGNSLGCQFQDSSFPNTNDRGIVRNGAIYNVTGSDALYMTGNANQVYNVLFYNNFRGFTQTTGSTAGGCNTTTQVYNNLFYNNTLAIQLGFGTSPPAACTGLTVDLTNNIIISNTQHIALYNGWTSAGRRNAGACGASCGILAVTLAAVTDCSVSTLDFHLKSDTTPCSNVGITESIVTTDKDLVSRPRGTAYDIGPYEFPVSLVDTTPPAQVQNVTVQ